MPLGRPCARSARCRTSFGSRCCARWTGLARWSRSRRWRCAPWSSLAPDACWPAWPPSTFQASTHGMPTSSSWSSPTRPRPERRVNRDLEGKTALVTGGGKGIGRAISQSLAAMGAKVVVNYRSDKAAAEETAATLEGAVTHQADVGDPAQVEAMIKSVGRVDVLVNNAGAVRDKLLIQMSPPDWEELIRTDLMSVFATTRAAIMSGMMRARWGRIVNISSIVGITGNAGQSNYSAAKAGLIGFTKSIAREHGSRNITCNAVAPGYVRTELTSGALTDEMVAEMVKMTPIKREGTAEEVAAAAAFLCSERAGVLTGQVVAVDGGLSLETWGGLDGGGGGVPLGAGAR